MASLRCRLWRRLLQPDCIASLPLRELRRRFDAGARSDVPAPVQVEPVYAVGLAGEWLVPPEAPARRCLLYLHGGHHVMGWRASHRALAALDDALAALRWLAGGGYAPRDIAIGGDGTGAGLALATLVALRDAGDALPGRFVALSPWVDFTCGGDSIAGNAARDRVVVDASLCLRRHYAAPEQFAHPPVSPLHADLRGLPPMLLHAGGDERLRCDTTRLAARARDAGVPVAAKVWPRMWHVFQAAAPWLPESNAAIDEVGAFLRACRPDRESVANKWAADSYDAAQRNEEPNAVPSPRPRPIALALPVVLAAALAAGCASQPEVRRDRDPAVALESYKTFAFFEPAQNAPYPSLAATRARQAAREQLEKHHYVYSERDPDLRVAVLIGVADKVELRSPPGRWGRWAGGVESVEYQQGTLRIDLVDARRNAVVWQGTAVGRLDRDALDAGGRVEATVARIFDGFGTVSR